jgi:hypothetical protein
VPTSLPPTRNSLASTPRLVLELDYVFEDLMNEPIRGDVILASVYGRSCPDPKGIFPTRYLVPMSDAEIIEARAHLVWPPAYPPLAPIPPLPRVRPRHDSRGCIFW